MSGAARRPLPPPALVLAIVGLLGAALWVRWQGWGFISRDMAHFLYFWVDELRQLGFPGLATTSANYNPPYLYLLLAGLQLDPAATAAQITKAISTLFDIGLAGTVAWSVPREPADSTRPAWLRPALAFVATLLLPTVWMNSAVWGQCDAIYSFWLLLGFLLAERRQDAASALTLVSALAFKLQAAFLGPVVLAVAWCARQRWQFAVLLVAGYVAWLWPSVIAGRPWGEALTVYLHQATSEMDLSLGAPNLWTPAKYVFTSDAAQKAALFTGLAVTVIAMLAAIPFCIRMVQRSREHLLPLACTVAFMVPFMLPKMHERYFYPADVFSLALAFRDRRWLLITALIQLGSATAYLGYLSELPGPVVRLPGILANCVVAVLLVRHWWRAWHAPVGTGPSTPTSMSHAH
ncbi:hypothetical protein [Pelomonas cellulosilytica]|uniref:DUF2029 domain-containing protein n=1 Tax=Pelomonas cellulosilytica TaxID=2906762 RepID=A0ABS8Y0Q2_9BURK|nr:hypothetical protein [Pelomonas sp. P8]MCE4557555.1 hypothetical protein [Pelomonas sp. P8]